MVNDYWDCARIKMEGDFRGDAGTSPRFFSDHTRQRIRSNSPPKIMKIMPLLAKVD